MLPDIVRAAAEPMANIGQLTVLSNDGASDLVKNVTRTVTEASTTVKGLTGIDIPDLLNQALGTSGDEPPASGGGGGGGGGGSSRPRPPASPPKSGGSADAPTAGGAAGGPRATGGRAQAGATRTSPSSTTATGAGTGGSTASGAADSAPPRFETPEAVEAAIAEADRAMRTAGSAQRPRTDTAAGPAVPASAGITRETTADEAAQRLAADLRSVPGIARFADVRLAQLDSAGPRPLRTMWRLARDQVAERYGQMSIGELIDRFGGTPPRPS